MPPGNNSLPPYYETPIAYNDPTYSGSQLRSIGNVLFALPPNLDQVCFRKETVDTPQGEVQPAVLAQSHRGSQHANVYFLKDGEYFSRFEHGGHYWRPRQPLTALNPEDAVTPEQLTPENGFTPSSLSISYSQSNFVEDFLGEVGLTLTSSQVRELLQRPYYSAAGRPHSFKRAFQFIEYDLISYQYYIRYGHAATPKLEPLAFPGSNLGTYESARLIGAHVTHLLATILSEMNVTFPHIDGIARPQITTDFSLNLSQFVSATITLFNDPNFIYELFVYSPPLAQQHPQLFHFFRAQLAERFGISQAVLNSSFSDFSYHNLNHHMSREQLGELINDLYTLTVTATQDAIERARNDASSTQAFSQRVNDAIDHLTRH